MQANLAAVEGWERRGPQYTFRADARDDLEPTKAQLRILELLSHGCTVEQAASAEGIAYSTAQTHLDKARERLSLPGKTIKTKTHAVAEAIRIGLIR